MPQPIRVFCSGLTGHIYASRRYTERGNGLFVSQSKDDVTQDAIAAVREHMEGCTNVNCLCRTVSRLREVGP